MRDKEKITKLDPTKKVARISISDEHPDPLYFDENGIRIAYVDEVIKYKPKYDFETRRIKHWWYKNESELFRDTFYKVKTFRSRTTIGKYTKAMSWYMLDKWVLRFFS